MTSTVRDKWVNAAQTYRQRQEREKALRELAPAADVKPDKAPKLRSEAVQRINSPPVTDRRWIGGLRTLCDIAAELRSLSANGTIIALPESRRLDRARLHQRQEALDMRRGRVASAQYELAGINEDFGAHGVDPQP